VIVEGPFDAVAVTTVGAGRYVGVAPCGTNLTGSQVVALDRAVPLAERGVTVAFDCDDAGRAAAARTYAPLRATGAWPHAAELPDGQDPAGLARSAGSQALTAVLDEAIGHPLADVLVDEKIARFSDRLGTAEGRVYATRAAAEVIATLQGEHVGRQVIRLAGQLDVDPTTVTAEVVEAVTRDGDAVGRLRRRERPDDIGQREATEICSGEFRSASILAGASFPMKERLRQPHPRTAYAATNIPQRSHTPPQRRARQ
jgi:DNA primase